MTMSENIYNKSCQLKLNDINYHVYYYIKFYVNFNTQFYVTSIIHIYIYINKINLIRHFQEKQK